MLPDARPATEEHYSLGQEAGTRSSTPPWQRALRVVRLLAHVGRMWFAARFLCSAGDTTATVAIRYRALTGEPSTAAAYIDDMSIVDSLKRLSAAPSLVVELEFCAPLFARGRRRRDLSQLAHDAVARALGLPAAAAPRATKAEPTRRAA